MAGTILSLGVDSIISEITVGSPVGGISGGSGAVSSVFGRAGAVTAQGGDYSFPQISGTVGAAQLPLFTSVSAGAVPASGGGAVNFLRADGTWSPASGTGGGTVTSVGMIVPAGMAVGGSPITGSGILTISWSGTIPNTSIPPPTTTVLGGVQSATAPANQFATGINPAGQLTFAQPSFANLSGSVALSQLPSISNNTVLGNATGITAPPTALSATQLANITAVFSATQQGVVPASGGGSVNFMRADGTWAAPPTGGGGGVVAYTYQNASFGATAQVTYLVDTTTAALTVTLPASPPVGSNITLLDAGSTWATNNVTVAGNGSNIASSSSNLTLNISGSEVVLAYVNATIGWQVYTR